MSSFYVFHIIRTLFFLGLSVPIIIFCFKTTSEINKLKELSIETNFTSQKLGDNWLINYLENELESNETNKYEEFFNKYNLTPGQTIYNNDRIKHSYKHLYNVFLATAIILIIFSSFSLFSLIPWFLLCFYEDDEHLPSCADGVGLISSFVIIIRIITQFVLFCVFLGFFIYYKEKFENDFFKFYEEINNSNEQASFKAYYNSLFELKHNLLINIILKPINIFIAVSFVIYFFKTFNN